MSVHAAQCVKRQSAVLEVKVVSRKRGVVGQIYWFGAERSETRIVTTDALADTNIVMRASAARHNLAHRVATIVRSIRIAVFRHYALVSPHAIGAVPGIVRSHNIRSHGCVVHSAT